VKQYRFKFITKEGVLLGYFLSIGSKLVSQQEAKVFNADESVLDNLKEYTLDKLTFQGLNIDDIIITEEEL
jgi:hypothetical protein